MKKKVALLCSGGVDSSVALHYLRNNFDYDIVVFYLKIWLEDELTYLGQCPWEEDVSYIARTCQMLGVSFEQVPLQKEYWNLVVQKSISMIKNGYTPNPDIFCNSMVKFGAFHDLYGADFDFLSTGHYAHIQEEGGWRYLTHTCDEIKDQTYFLSYTPYEKIKKSLFPLGVFLNKEQVRNYAIRHNLPSAFKKDSQGICFLGKIPFVDFIAHHCGIQKGLLIEYETNSIKGEHNGFWFFTIGQRQGIGLSGGPWYVIAKDHQENTVYISKKSPKEQAINYNMIVAVHDINYLVPELEFLSEGCIYKIKIRHGKDFNECLILERDNSKKNIVVKILHPDQGVACGQCMVFYDDKKRCIGGGIINSVERSFTKNNLI